VTIATRAQIISNLAQGLGVYQPFIPNAPSGGTSAAFNSGGFTLNLGFNNIGTSLWGTLVSAPQPPSLPNSIITSLMGGCSLAQPTLFGWLYKIGTLNLAATGNQLTHDAATFPILRTRFGAASTAIPLIPLVTITTLTATTAPIFQLKTNAGAAGYTNQDGSSVIGTKSFTFPSTGTTVNSTYIIRPEDGDSAVRDINQINVSAAGTAGAATVWGFEALACLQVPTGAYGCLHDTFFAGMLANHLEAGLATSGTAVASLVMIQFNTSISNANLIMTGVVNS
jgi:hypothetical protein